jgi:Flp pilus assembly pilin Flp
MGCGSEQGSGLSGLHVLVGVPELDVGPARRRVVPRQAADAEQRAVGSPGDEGELVMKAMKNLVSKLVRDERGGEVLEYALIAGLIVVAAIAVIGSVGTKVLARWNSLDSSM